MVSNDGALMPRSIKRGGSILSRRTHNRLLRPYSEDWCAGEASRVKSALTAYCALGSQYQATVHALDDYIAYVEAYKRPSINQDREAAEFLADQYWEPVVDRSHTDRFSDMRPGGLSVGPFSVGPYPPQGSY